MTNEDFSNGFDTLLNAYAHTASFGTDTSIRDIRVDEYEKSLLLTESQEEIVLSLYTGRNSSGNSFEETEELRRYLSPLISEALLEPAVQENTIGISNHSEFFELPQDVWFITYESVHLLDNTCDSLTTIEVRPVAQDEYHRIKQNPFKGANDRRALRLDLHDNVVEIVSKFNILEYYIRYLKQLKPIILESLPDGMTIKGISTETPCELHESLHRRILERAVERALMSKAGTSARQNTQA